MKMLLILNNIKIASCKRTTTSAKLTAMLENEHLPLTILKKETCTLQNNNANKDANGNNNLRRLHRKSL